MFGKGEPLQVAVEDEYHRLLIAAGAVPEAAITHPITVEQVEKQLSRTGGTPYRCLGTKALVEEGLSVPLSALNALRRQVLEELSLQRQTLPQRRVGQFHPGARYENPSQSPALTVSVRKAAQVSPELDRKSVV